MKKNIRFCFWLSLLVFAACSTEAGLQQILGVEAEPPVFLDCRPISSTEMVFNFTTPVRVVTLNFDPVQETESIEEGSAIKVTFTGPIEAGSRITADILVEDSEGNSLNVIVPFRARNDRMPPLVFNELRTEYSNPRAEFVEFIAQGPGNLAAMRLFIAGHSLSKPAYEFPSAEVEAGEYIVLHLRAIEDGCVDETGKDLALSTGTDAQDGARDFWLPETKKIIHKTDALWLLDQDDGIIDAVLLSENSGAAWSKDYLTEAAEFLGREKAWLPVDSGSNEDEGRVLFPSDAIMSTGSTTTRTICRDESLPPENRAGNWYITATSSATPGGPNNPKRYASSK